MVYWRCSVCDNIELTSPYVVQLMHTHNNPQYPGGMNFSLLACRSLKEAKSYRKVRRKGRFGLRKTAVAP
jgi:hypothetical protein